MEASDPQESGDLGQPQSGSTDAVGGTEQDQSQGEQPDQSQEQPQDDSQLTTPQPDQPAPSEAERQAQDEPDASQAAQPVQNEPDASQTAQPTPSQYKPRHEPLQNAGLDQNAAEEQRQAELAAQRDQHNARVAGEPQATQPAEGSG